MKSFAQFVATIQNTALDVKAPPTDTELKQFAESTARMFAIRLKGNNGTRRKAKSDN